MSSTSTEISDYEMERMSNVEDGLLGNMLQNFEPARPSTIPRSDHHSFSLGNMDVFPVEIMTMICEELDFQSLSRLSQASSRGKAFVESLPAYQEMMQHAPETLTALGKTGLLKWHSSTLLRETLRSNECVSCFGFGAFLLLPTCERTCFCCLSRNSALRVMRLDDAKKLFGLTDEQLSKTPIMTSIPGVYSLRSELVNRRYSVKRIESMHLVNVRQAKRVALDIHKCMTVIRSFMDVDSLWINRHPGAELRALREAPMDPPGTDMSQKNRQRCLMVDQFGGTATIRFPYLSTAGPDIGRLCLGCETVFALYEEKKLPLKVYKSLAGDLCYPRECIRARISRLHPVEVFKEHVKDCYGIQWILALKKPKIRAGNHG